MTQTPRTILFDLDGTLVDTGADLALAVNLTRRGLGLGPVEIPLVVANVGNGVHDLLRLTIPEHPFDEDLLQTYVSHYRGHLLDNSRPYPGIPELLTRLRDGGHRLGVVTNKTSTASRQIIDGLGLAPFFPVLIGDGDGHALKPDAAPLHLAAERLGAPLTADDWMVGDMETDLFAALAAGVKSGFCAWGFRPAPPGPATVCLNHPLDLLPHL